jgi:predicted DNA-binding transcriptional regulator AlpA
VSFPEVTSIGNGAFNSCTNLTNVNFPKAIDIGASAFYRTALSIIDGISDFPAATSIGAYAFDRLTSLISVSFPEVTSIGDYAFYECINLASVSFPKAINTGMSTFMRCSSLTIINGITDFPMLIEISWEAFARCTGLTDVHFPEATTIRGRSFEDCTNLSSVSIPKVRVFPSSSANFHSCPNIKTVTVAADLSGGLAEANLNFRSGFFAYYIEQGRLAGTYILENSTWTGPFEP